MIKMMMKNLNMMNKIQKTIMEKKMIKREKNRMKILTNKILLIRSMSSSATFTMMK